MLADNPAENLHADIAMFGVIVLAGVVCVVARRRAPSFRRLCRLSLVNFDPALAIVLIGRFSCS